MRVWVYAELDDGVLSPSALELTTRGCQLGEVTAVALGPGGNQAAEALAEYGASHVYIAEDPRLTDGSSQPQAQVFTELLAEAQPELCLFASTTSSRDVAGRVAARLGVGAVVNALSVEMEGELLRATVPYFGGAKVGTLRVNSRPAIVLVRPKAYEPALPSPGNGVGEGVVEEIDLTKYTWLNSPQVVSQEREGSTQVQLEAAEVVVVGGRGLGRPENFQLIEELAAALHGASGATRAIVDAGWVPYALQVGQTGKTVRPKVYFAVGVSGAMQHTVGMSGSELVIAINKDPEAPIFKLADLGIVGDALRILPQLTEAVKRTPNT